MGVYFKIKVDTLHRQSAAVSLRRESGHEVWGVSFWAQYLHVLTSEDYEDHFGKGHGFLGTGPLPTLGLLWAAWELSWPLREDHLAAVTFPCLLKPEVYRE